MKPYPARAIQAAMAALLALLAFSGCTPASEQSRTANPTGRSGATSTAPSGESTVPITTDDTETSATTKAGDALPHAISAESAKYAESLGGNSHENERLYFIIGASVRSERDAQKELSRALPLFGDMQSYFIVQRSESFEGMRPGWWVVIEAYRKQPSRENLMLARRAFPDAYVKTATVGTSYPIPVYEDQVSGD